MVCSKKFTRWDIIAIFLIVGLQLRTTITSLFELHFGCSWTLWKAIESRFHPWACGGQWVIITLLISMFCTKCAGCLVVSM